jgi:geranylgeranyl diphosphate synthase type I
VAVPACLDDVAKRVDVRIEELLDRETTRWRAVDVDLAAPLTALRDLVMAGGKRLRPTFCWCAYTGAGGDPEDPRVTDAGAALELLHTFALVHDDIMDGSARRRGLPTIHRLFEDAHGADHWRGEGRRFGEGVAILVGDLAFVYADLLLSDAPPEAVDVFTELRLEVNIGQYLDLVGTARGDVRLEQARRIARYKSGKYTIERPLHLGAALAGRLDDLRAPLTAYGDPLGEAFQLRDDLLGAFGDMSLTGKPVGEDLREGKPTALLAWAARSGVDLAGRGIGRADLSDAEVADLQSLLEDSGARREVERTIDELTNEALAALERLDLAEESVAELAELARFVAGRHF